MIDDREMKNLLELSRLTATPEETAALQSQLQDIFDYFEILKTYDTEEIDVDLGESVAFTSRRHDEERPGVNRDAIVGFSTTFENGYFVVPRIIGENDDE